ncbi:uncharacterized protein F5891DRAFT_944335, partial [Suillus fuscotomentosus]
SKDPKAIYTGNTRLHGMTIVIAALVAYVATQFALCSSLVLLCTNTVTDLETFYHSLLDLLKDTGECREVIELLLWWNQ